MLLLPHGWFWYFKTIESVNEESVRKRMTWICSGLGKLSLTATLRKLMLSQMKNLKPRVRPSHKHQVMPVSHSCMHILLYHNYLAVRMISAWSTMNNIYINLLQVLGFLDSWIIGILFPTLLPIFICPVYQGAVVSNSCSWPRVVIQRYCIFPVSSNQSSHFLISHQQDISTWRTAAQWKSF